MSSPVSPNNFDRTPNAAPRQPEVFYVASPAVFEVVRRLVEIVHVTQFNQPPHSFVHAHHIFRSMGSMSDQDMDLDLEMEDYFSQTPKPQRETDPLRLSVEENLVPEGDLKKDRHRLSSDVEVPNFSEIGRHSKDDKIRYQKLVMEIMDRIARIVRDMNLAKEIQYTEKNHWLQKNASQEEAVVQRSTTEKISGEGKKTPEISNEGDQQQIDLILEKWNGEGHLEKIPVKRGVLSHLLQNLDGLLQEKEADPSEDSTPISPSLAPSQVIAEKKSKKSKALDQTEASSIKKNADTGKVRASPDQQPGKASSQATGGINLSPSQAAAAMVRFMPYSSTAEVRAGLEETEGNRVNEVGKTEGISPFTREDTREKEGARNDAAALVSKKLGGKVRSDLREISEVVTKEQPRKSSPSLRTEEGKIVPVVGKFTVDQLREVRRKRGKKGAGEGKSSQLKTHRMIDLLYMILAAAVSGSQTTFDIAAYIESKENFFKTLLGLRNGIPSPTLLTKLLVSFNPSQLTEMISLWMREAQGAPAKTGLASLVVSETFEGLIFGQEKTIAGSQAENCMPRIVQFFQMRGVVILLSNGKSSQHCVRRIIENGAHYIYDCGEDPFPGENEALPLFEQALANPKGTAGVDYTESYVEGHERLQLYETRAALADGIKSLCQLIGEVHSAEGKEETIQYFTSSLQKPSIWLFELMRAQRGLEDKMEWMMNLSMRGKHGDEAAFAAREFFAVLRGYALNLLVKDQSFKAPISAKQSLASKNDEYLMKVLRL